MDDSSFFNEEFFKKYGFVSCYECDEIAYSKEELYEHIENCPWLVKEKQFGKIEAG
tara:strand:- start:231 stop:398 length:168 start_codon:yes stop_codon:yes gene_type:complete